MAQCVKEVLFDGPDLQPPYNHVLVLDGGTNIASCSLVVLTGAEFAANNASGGLPPAGDVAAVWTVGFSMVVVCFLIGRAVGAVLEFIRRG